MQEDSILIDDVLALQSLVILKVTDGYDKAKEEEYQLLRARLLSKTAVRELLPKFILTCRDLTQIWGYIAKRQNLKTYQERRDYIYDSFVNLLNTLEFGNSFESNLPKGEFHNFSKPNHVEKAEYDLKRLREFILDKIGQDDFDTLIFDNFHAVRNNLPMVMKFDQKITELLNYCLKHDLMQKLIDELKNMRPYENFEFYIKD
jgi:plasmid stabilization system protein ParE